MISAGRSAPAIHVQVKARIAAPQRDELKSRARKLHVSVSQLLRSMIARELEASRNSGSLPDESAIREMAILVAVELVVKLQEATIPGGITRSRQLLESAARAAMARIEMVEASLMRESQAMRSSRSVLALRYTPVSVMGGLRKAVGGFLRYVQYRDQHAGAGARRRPRRLRPLRGAPRPHLARAAASSVATNQQIGVDRKQLVDYITRSTKDLAPKWVEGRDGKRIDRQRAAYTFVLSPEDWRGLDLRRLARVAMERLEADAGTGGIGPWIAAEHRNTAHHHVHIVLAARRELGAERFQTVLITRARLQRMKDAIGREIDRQRGPSPDAWSASTAQCVPVEHQASTPKPRQLSLAQEAADPAGSGRVDRAPAVK